jgi:hypothetical protein
MRKDHFIADPDLENANPAAIELVLKFSEKFLSFALLNTLRNEISGVGLVSYLSCDELADLIEKQALLKILLKGYGRTIILIDTMEYTLIPEKLYDAGNSSKYLALAHRFGENELYNTDYISHCRAINIYKVPSEVMKFSKQNFALFQFRHTASVLIHVALHGNSLKACLVNFNGNKIDVVVSTEGSLTYCNSFIFHNTAEIIFYLMSVLCELGMKADGKIIFTGDLSVDDHNFSEIKKYFPSIVFAVWPHKFAYCKALSEEAAHRNYDLFNAFLCV